MDCREYKEYENANEHNADNKKFRMMKCLNHFKQSDLYYSLQKIHSKRFLKMKIIL